jgi:hypothetical protein
MEGTSSVIVPLLVLGGLGWVCVLAFDQFLDMSSCVVVSCLFDVDEVAYGSSIPCLGMALKASNVVGNQVTLHRIW